MAICQCGKAVQNFVFPFADCRYVPRGLVLQVAACFYCIWLQCKEFVQINVENKPRRCLAWASFLRGELSHTAVLWMKSGRRESHRYLRAYLCVWTSEGECNALLTRGIYLIIWPIVLFSFLGPFHTLSPSHLHCHRPGQLIHVPSAHCEAPGTQGPVASRGKGRPLLCVSLAALHTHGGELPFSCHRNRHGLIRLATPPAEHAGKGHL